MDLHVRSQEGKRQAVISPRPRFRYGSFAVDRKTIRESIVLHMPLTFGVDFHSSWYMKLRSSRGSDWKWELADASSAAGRRFASDAVRFGGESAMLTERFASWVSRYVCWLMWTVRSEAKACRSGVG